MSSLVDPDKIDYLCISKEGDITAVIVDDFQDDDQRQRLAMLQVKVGRYLDFIESGEVFEEASRMAGHAMPQSTAIAIEIIAKTPLDDVGTRFLHLMTDDVGQTGVVVSFRVQP